MHGSDWCNSFSVENCGAISFVLFFLYFVHLCGTRMPSFTTFQPVDLTWMKPQVFKSHTHTVDGRNPAAVDR